MFSAQVIESSSASAIFGFSKFLSMWKSMSTRSHTHPAHVNPQSWNTWKTNWIQLTNLEMRHVFRWLTALSSIDRAWTALMGQAKRRRWSPVEALRYKHVFNFGSGGLSLGGNWCLCHWQSTISFRWSRGCLLGKFEHVTSFCGCRWQAVFRNMDGQDQRYACSSVCVYKKVTSSDS